MGGDKPSDDDERRKPDQSVNHVRPIHAVKRPETIRTSPMTRTVVGVVDRRKIAARFRLSGATKQGIPSRIMAIPRATSKISI